MNTKHLFSMVLLASLLFSACAKYETQFEGPYKDGAPASGSNAPFEIVYALDGNLYFASTDLRRIKQIPLTASVEQVSINYSHDLIAYKGNFGGINIIDTAGNFIAEVPNSDNAGSFDWHANNQTLYMIRNETVVTYGPAIDLAYTDLSDAHNYSGTDYFYSLGVLPAGDLVFGYGVTGFGGTQYIGYRITYLNPGFGQYDHDMPLPGANPGDLRVSEDGKTVLTFDHKTAGTFDTSFDSPFTPLANNVDKGAIAPAGNDFIFRYEGDRYITRFGTNQKAEVGYGYITDIDW